MSSLGKQYPRSAELFTRAKKVIPGGVNSPVRAFRAVGGDPLFISRGAGSKVWDADDNEYIDYVCSWGPLILGHAHPLVRQAIIEAAAGGTSFGASTEREVIFAEALVQHFPSLEKVRLVSSGTEATMSALRLARGFTGRPKIIKFDGGYHGHHDSLLVRAGSGAATLGVPDSAGVTPGVAADTITLPYNNFEAAEEIFRQNGEQIAALIIEPVAGNMGVVPPRAGYLARLRALTKNCGALLLFDEVITGFRLGLGGAQQFYGVHPDLTCLGKIIGGGLPVGAYGGRGEIMDHISPEGPVYQAGTLSGNPLAVAAGLKTLAILEKDQPYATLEKMAAQIEENMLSAARECSVPLQVNRVGSMFTAFFTETQVVDWPTAKTCDTAKFGAFHRAMREAGIYLAPSQFEAGFVSTAHTAADIDKTSTIFRQVLKTL